MLLDVFSTMSLIKETRISFKIDLKKALNALIVSIFSPLFPSPQLCVKPTSATQTHYIL